MESSSFEREYTKLIEEVERGDDLDYYLEDQDRELEFLAENRSRFRYITSQIPRESKMKILDIGTTSYSILLNRFFDDAEVHTIDIVDLYEDRVESEGVHFEECNITSEELPYPDSEFDVIIFSEVLEHLFGSPYDILERISRTLKDGGKLVFGTPNLARLKNRVLFALGRNPFNVSKTGDYYAHVREYSIDELRHIVNRAGLSVEQAERKEFHDLREFVVWNGIKRYSGPKPLVIPPVVVYYLATQFIPSTRTYLYLTCRPE